ncbi:MAG: hypothetical protein V4534_05410 [Myxococcota bacterium]
MNFVKYIIFVAISSFSWADEFDLEKANCAIEVITTTESISSDATLRLVQDGLSYLSANLRFLNSADLGNAETAIARAQLLINDYHSTGSAIVGPRRSGQSITEAQAVMVKRARDILAFIKSRTDKKTNETLIILHYVQFLDLLKALKLDSFDEDVINGLRNESTQIVPLQKLLSRGPRVRISPRSAPRPNVGRRASMPSNSLIGPSDMIPRGLAAPKPSGQSNIMLPDSGATLINGRRRSAPRSAPGLHVNNQISNLISLGANPESDVARDDLQQIASQHGVVIVVLVWRDGGWVELYRVGEEGEELFVYLTRVNDTDCYPSFYRGPHNPPPPPGGAGAAGGGAGNASGSSDGYDPNGAAAPDEPAPRAAKQHRPEGGGKRHNANLLPTAVKALLNRFTVPTSF